jgi:hypothetical protein
MSNRVDGPLVPVLNCNISKIPCPWVFWIKHAASVLLHQLSPSVTTNTSITLYYNCIFQYRLETCLYRYYSDGPVVIFLKTDRDSEAIVRYCTYKCYTGYCLRISRRIYPSYEYHMEQRGWVESRDYFQCEGPFKAITKRAQIR